MLTRIQVEQTSNMTKFMGIRGNKRTQPGKEERKK